MTGPTLAGLLVLHATALSAVMFVATVIQARTGNTGWIDTVWTIGLGGIGISTALWPPVDDITARQWLVAGLVALWALRLGWHIARRSARLGDDPRYRQLIEGWGADAPRQMAILLQKQALVSIPMALTLALAAYNPAPLWRLIDVAAVVVFACGAALEALADRQLRQHREGHPARSSVCDGGLWAVSRHPNYFGEWLMWVALALLAFGDWGWGFMAVAGPVAMYWLLTAVSGIPPLEAHMLRTRGSAYRRYQERTSAFFPWPPARTAATNARKAP